MEKDSKVLSALKGMASHFDFTPRTLADSFDSLINKQLAVISKRTLKEKPRFKVCYFEMAENTNDPNKPPFMKMFGVLKDNSRYLIRSIDSKTEIIDIIMDDSSLGMLKMASNVFSMDIEPMLEKFHLKTNIALNDEMLLRQHPIKIVIFIGKNKLRANLSDNKNNFYKKGFEFSSLIPKDETF